MSILNNEAHSALLDLLLDIPYDEDSSAARANTSQSKHFQRFPYSYKLKLKGHIGTLTPHVWLEEGVEALSQVHRPTGLYMFVIMELGQELSIFLRKSKHYYVAGKHLKVKAAGEMTFTLDKTGQLLHYNFLSGGYHPHGDTLTRQATAESEHLSAWAANLPRNLWRPRTQELSIDIDNPLASFILYHQQQAPSHALKLHKTAVLQHLIEDVQNAYRQDLYNAISLVPTRPPQGPPAHSHRRLFGSESLVRNVLELNRRTDLKRTNEPNIPIPRPRKSARSLPLSPELNSMRRLFPIWINAGLTNLMSSNATDTKFESRETYENTQLLDAHKAPTSDASQLSQALSSGKVQVKIPLGLSLSHHDRKHLRAYHHKMGPEAPPSSPAIILSPTGPKRTYSHSPSLSMFDSSHTRAL